MIHERYVEKSMLTNPVVNGRIKEGRKAKATRLYGKKTLHSLCITGRKFSSRESRTLMGSTPSLSGVSTWMGGEGGVHGV